MFWPSSGCQILSNTEGTDHIDEMGHWMDQDSSRVIERIENSFWSETWGGSCGQTEVAMSCPSCHSEMGWEGLDAGKI